MLENTVSYLGGRFSIPGRMGLMRIILPLGFLGVILYFSYQNYFVLPGGTLLIVAAVIGGYMAMNIGANDSANNIGPAVGSGALTLGAGMALAAIAEASGALIAGGDVVGTIKKGIIDPSLIRDNATFIWIMLAALLAAALWLNLATYMGAPVSTTHSIVGGVLGAGIAAGGWNIADWDKVGAIVMSWVISPVMGGLISAVFLYLIKRSIVFRRDKTQAAKKFVPIFVSLMAWVFGSYLILKGLKKIWTFDFLSASIIGLGLAVVTYLIVRPMIARAAQNIENSRDGINQLFTMPLIFGAALLSFAHGANDVANAIGPLAAINDAVLKGGITAKATIPFWVMTIGAVGISIGLVLFGARVIRRVGKEITELDQVRAFCIALAAAITVIVASQLGLPVSTTHITVGAVFGVGFLRELVETNHARKIEQIRNLHGDDASDVLDAFLDEYEASNLEEKGLMLQTLEKNREQFSLSKKDQKRLSKVYRKELVKRSMIYRIIAAWVITVPVAGILAAMLFYMIRGFMLP